MNKDNWKEVLPLFILVAIVFSALGWMLGFHFVLSVESSQPPATATSTPIIELDNVHIEVSLGEWTAMASGADGKWYFKDDDIDVDATSTNDGMTIYLQGNNIVHFANANDAPTSTASGQATGYYFEASSTCDLANNYCGLFTPTSTPQVETWSCQFPITGVTLTGYPSSTPPTLWNLVQTTGTSTPESEGYSDCTLRT